MLNRLEKSGVVRRSQEISHREQKVNHNAPDIWSLPDINMNVTPDNRDHELDCVDFLVCLFNSLDDKSRLSHWDYSWDSEEKNYWAVKNKVYFDRRFVLDDCLYFLEVDNGTKDPDSIRRQMDGYVKLSQAFPKERFTVLFTTQSYRKATAEGRRNTFIKLAAELRRGDQFLIALHKHTTMPDGNPLLRVWHSPRVPDRLVAFSDLD